MRPGAGLPCPSRDLNPLQVSQARALCVSLEQPLLLTVEACELHVPVEAVITPAAEGWVGGVERCM